MQSKRSPILWISLIIVAVIVVAGVVYYSQSTDTEGNENSNGNSNTTLNTNAATNSNTNSGVDTSNWKSYENTKHGYSIKIPDTWGRISELDGSVTLDLSKGSTPTTSSLTVGSPTDITEKLFIQVHQMKNTEQFLEDDTIETGSGPQQFILGSSKFMTSTGVSGQAVDLDSSIVEFDFAYIFQVDDDLIDIRFQSANDFALPAINTLSL